MQTQSAMVVRRLVPSELAWANQCYVAINFVPSSAADFIAVAQVQGERAAIGRVTPIAAGTGELGGIHVLPAFRGRALAGSIVDYLIANCGMPKLYCIPFSHLERFYVKHGFLSLPKDAGTPAPIQSKLQWCQEHYAEPVMLLVRTQDG